MTATQCLTNRQLFNEKEMPDDKPRARTTERCIYLGTATDAGLDEPNEGPGSDVKPNAIKKLLYDAWATYFQSLKGSDQEVIEICNKANGLELDNAKNAISEVIGSNKEYDDVSAGIEAFLK